MEKHVSISQIKEIAQEAYEQVKGTREAKRRLIPYLANIDKNLFGISICLMNGETITLGDYDYRFGIESASKYIRQCLPSASTEPKTAEMIEPMLLVCRSTQLWRFCLKRPSVHSVGKCRCDYGLQHGSTAWRLR